MITIQILAETEYQDLYRVTDGVLLVVNKFEYVLIDKSCPSIYHAKQKIYNKGCQNCLKELKENFYYAYCDITFPKGTILYNSHPVKLVDKHKWEYQIKTTSDYFSGNMDRILKLLNEIINKIKE